MVISLVKEFDDKGSFIILIKKLLKKRLQKKYFVHHYDIKFDPIRNELSFRLECPKALVRVSAIGEKGQWSQAQY